MTKQQQIKSFLSGKPEGQFNVGLLATKVGRKYVHFIILHEGGKGDKIEIDDFFETYIAKKPWFSQSEIDRMEAEGQKLIAQGYYL